ncbi:PEP-CTERM sorting domain-containing protein [Microcystis aeruginosa]|uniref:Ice-binding protein C-terminal domain-containing protein n=1 Tax=Microcystis aeruginosa NIES-2521 TaxID=2303983 RepID=A0A5A5S5N6_MICAE|nr:PEP-CTERM sorting domain-containing protein [Microcystis aeruginosa]GCA79886.1 hypothetical protein MiTs_01885 [Microcystis aeruginosa NIES-2521]
MSLKTSLAVATTAIGLTILASPAQASRLYSFSYTDVSGKVLSGTLTGTAAGNVVTVTGYNNDLTYDGTLLSWGAQTYVYSWTQYNNLTSPSPILPAQLSFDGTVLDFVAGDIEDFSGSYFAFGDIGLGQEFTRFFAGDNDPVTEAFTTLNWELQLVPEPGSVVALLGLGLGALASKVRKQG